MDMRRSKHGARAGAWYLLIAAVCAIVVTACGSAAAPGSGAAASSSSSSPHATGGPGSSPEIPKISLSIDVSHGPGTAIVHWTLQCQPAGGTHPDPARACRVLMSAKNPFAPIPRGIMCPMIVAGTKVATVRGTWYGQPVNVTMSQGGCWLSRWAKVGQIFN
jgi:Subtilisin inhibitor-like